jgi:probable HAF family extracellular repeat protein
MGYINSFMGMFTKSIRVYLAIMLSLPIALSIAAISWADSGFTDIGVFQATAINTSGEIAGYSCCNTVQIGPNNQHFDYPEAVIWTPSGGEVSLSAQINGVGSQAFGLNDDGEVVGNFIPTVGGTPHAFSWTSSGGTIDLGTLGGQYTYANAVNNNGMVVGSGTTSTGMTHAFVWTPSGGISDIGTLGGNYSYAAAVNDSGVVVGNSTTADLTTTHAFVWTQSSGMIDLGALTGASGFSQAQDVNNTGEIVGNSDGHAVYWTTGYQINQLADVGVDGEQGAGALGVNDYGQIVGSVQSSSNGFLSTQPVSWGPSNEPVILPAYQLDSSYSTTVREIAYATAVNNSGEIVGTSVNEAANGANDAIVWNMPQVLSAPTNLAATSPAQYPTLSWTGVSGANSYSIYRNGSKIDSSESTSYTDSAAPEGDNTYYITAINSSGESAASSSVSVLVDRTPPTVGVLSWSSNPVSTAQTAIATISATDNLSGISGGEYYLGNTDPGQGNGTSMAYSNGNLTASFSGLSSGIYKVNFRAKDGAGNWSGTVSDYLVVYNPQAGGMSGHSNTVTPVYAIDTLPGLIQSGQTDQASFATSVKYDSSGNITSNSKLKFTYSTGTSCNKPSQAVNCHSLTLDSNSIQWLLVSGDDNSQGTIQGVATVTIDGVTTTNTFRLIGLDGALLTPQANDNITIQIFAPGDNPNTASPIYHINDVITKGSIKII